MPLWPGLGLEESPQPDIEIECRTVTKLDVGPSRATLAADEPAKIGWDGVGAVRVEANGARVIVDALPMSLDRLRALIQAVALPLALTLRGAIVIHGSCVKIGAMAASFMGPSGVGKSTLAAALHAAGHPLVSDGATVLWEHPGGVLAAPGPGLRRLWPDAIAHLGGDHEQYERAFPDEDKRLVPAPTMCERATPLTHLFVVEDGDDERICPLPLPEATVETARNLYLAGLVAPHSRGFLLQQAARIVRQVGVARLHRRQRLEHLAALVAEVQHCVQHPPFSP